MTCCCNFASYTFGNTGKQILHQKLLNRRIIISSLEIPLYANTTDAMDQNVKKGNLCDISYQRWYLQEQPLKQNCLYAEGGGFISIF